MANRDLISASIDIAAPPEKVWSIVSDLKRMGEWSPQCRKMIVRGGEVGVGTTTINVNRRGLLVWPTRSKVKVFEPNRELAFRVVENGTVWSYELEPTATGTRLTESRRAPHGVKKVSNVLTNSLMGGTDDFETELQAGIESTLATIKSTAEAS
ncbi:hypothetical protein HMPREF0063_11308 [Aeromicrobium marinum DSM 15272]|uniref:Polyketide cyclase/dehydrase n=1 Tax=Aeromicrobium marinum DSM 15272 TaxID=585531 RepID=E2SB99_9ACTN|nr:SRPBCC family protein [Aeromicrobium marinum]EFQ83645.1 hypothetical protein HMPREF0063_11308 [Aeromicrobium marinum DSM 15272]